MLAKLLFAGMLMASMVPAAKAQNVPPSPAVPLEPVAAIVDAFRTHSVVAVSEAGHGEEWGYTFLISLIRNPKLVAVLNDIVIENGSARYQDLADRFVRGEHVSQDDLRQIWRNTVAPGLGPDRPWIEVFNAVREVNATLPRARQLRLLLGDPPIEWEHVKSTDDHRKWVEMRDIFPADLIQREVLSKGRHALLRYGQAHYQRRQMVANYEWEGPAQTIVSRLEHVYTTRVFTIWTSRDVPKFQADAASWPAPSVALVRGTPLGATDFMSYFPSPLPRLAIRDGKVDFSKPIPRNEWRALRAEDQFDAVLYPGDTPPTIESPSLERCADSADVNEVIRRVTIGGPPPAAGQLKEFCAAAVAK